MTTFRFPPRASFNWGALIFFGLVAAPWVAVIGLAILSFQR